MPNNGYFDIKRDKETINAGGFKCHACLVGKPAREKSLDERYCLNCYTFLVKEATLLPQGKRPAWIPRQPETMVPTAQKVAQTSHNKPEGCNTGRTMSATVISPVTEDVTAKIQEFVSKGYSTRRIAQELDVSHMTVYRRIKELQGVLV